MNIQLTDYQERYRNDEEFRRKSLEHSKSWYQRNKARKLQVDNTREKRNNWASSDRWKEKNPEKVMWLRVRRRARDNHLEFNLDVEDLHIPDVCPVLGTPLDRWTADSKSRGFRPNAPSLDRIDNTKGYVKGNVVVVSNRANFLKKDATLEELVRVAEFYKKMQEVG